VQRPLPPLPPSPDFIVLLCPSSPPPAPGAARLFDAARCRRRRRRSPLSPTYFSFQALFRRAAASRIQNPALDDPTLILP
jgi:hypothetical protein